MRPHLDLKHVWEVQGGRCDLDANEPRCQLRRRLVLCQAEHALGSRIAQPFAHDGAHDECAAAMLSCHSAASIDCRESVTKP